MKVARDPQSPSFDLRMARTLLRRSFIGPENARYAAVGECCAPASDRRPSTLREDAPTAAGSRPSAVGVAVPRLDGLAFVAGHCQARNSGCWHRKAFRLFWTWKIRRGRTGRPAVPHDVRDLIRRKSKENPGWGAPRIHAVYNRPIGAASSLSLKWAGSITGTNAERPDRSLIIRLQTGHALQT
jgi:hypothetical protein